MLDGEEEREGQREGRKEASGKVGGERLGRGGGVRVGGETYGSAIRGQAESNG